MDFLRRHFDRLFLVLQVWVDGLVTLLGCFLGLWLYPRIFEVPPPDVRDYAQVFLLITGVTLFTFWFLDLYRNQKSILNVEEYRQITKAVAVSFLVTATLVFMLREAQSLEGTEHWLYALFRKPYELLKLQGTERYSRMLFLVVFATILFLHLLQRAWMFRLLEIAHEKGLGNVNVAIFGTGQEARRIQQKLKLFPTLGYRFVGFLDSAGEPVPEQIGGRPVLGSEDDLHDVLERHDISLVVVAKPELEEQDLIALCKRFEDFGVDYMVLPRLYHFFTKRYTITTLDSLPLITPQSAPWRPIYSFAKRAVDVVVAAVGLAVAAPLMLLIAIAIKLDSPGPVFFSQLRRGAQDRVFRMFKFRTMYADMCGDAVTPQHGRDPRVTRVGRILRKTSLDEIPQLWNVLKGDMSLVGPRPEMPFIVDQYDELQMRRLDVKPGITGLWQVSAARNAPIHENVDYDLYYIENQSFFLDALIFVLTLGTMLKLRSTN